MYDHAAEIRRLGLRAARLAGAGDEATPHQIVFSGGRTKIGATTLATNVAVSLAGQGLRTVLIDADATRASAAAACGCASSPHLGDVLAGRLDIHEVLQLGAGGVQVVAGCVSTAVTSCDERALQRLHRQVRALGRYADAVVVDVGDGASELTKQFWLSADDLILVTSPDPAAVMDTYATIKTMWVRPGANPNRRLRLLVNQAESDVVVADVHRRIDQSCRRFLDLPIELAGGVASDERPAAALRPWVLSRPDSPFARTIDALAAEFARRAGPEVIKQAA